MAENKYNLALVKTVTEKPVKHQEWYKERLKTKYIKKLKPEEIIHKQNAQNWSFLKDGLDDFRDGLPPAVQGGDFIKSEKGPGPAVHGQLNQVDSVKQPAAKKRLTRFQTYLSNSTPQQQQRRDYINEVEQGLLKHPLALYPHLEESVVPELFEDIVDLLDPQFNIHDNQDDETDILGKLDEQVESDKTSSKSARSDRQVDSKMSSESDRHTKDVTEGLSIRNPYRWLPRKDMVKDKKDGKKSKEKEKGWPNAPSEEEHIKKVTQDFCEWVADLGGESNNIEESTITSLFASGYETKPALSVPIHVVELSNVPQELRMSAAVPPPQPTKQAPNEGKMIKKISGEYEPSWVKFKYGAWYLNPRSWKKMDWTEQLVDPKQIKDQEMSEAKKKSNDLNQELSTMHASKAFTDFINKRNSRKPEFLEEVAEIQRKTAEEEQKRLEAEILAKQKKTITQLKEAQAAAY